MTVIMVMMDESDDDDDDEKYDTLADSLITRAFRTVWTDCNLRAVIRTSRERALTHFAPISDH